MDVYDPEGDHRYIQTRTGLALPYVNWAPGEPSNTADKCAYSVNTWNDNPWEKKFHVICEYAFI